MGVTDFELSCLVSTRLAHQTGSARRKNTTRFYARKGALRQLARIEDAYAGNGPKMPS
jgi:hypothetical protein